MVERVGPVEQESGSRSCGFADAGRGISICGGTFNQLHTKLPGDGAVLGVMSALIGRVVAYHAIVAGVHKRFTPAQNVGAK